MELDRLLLRDWKVTSNDDVEPYIWGCKYCSSYLRRIVQTAIRLSKFVLSIIRNISIQEDQELCLRNENTNPVRANSITKLICITDCCTFANFLYASSLKCTTSFTNGGTKLGRLHEFISFSAAITSLFQAFSNQCSTRWYWPSSDLLLTLIGNKTNF